MLNNTVILKMFLVKSRIYFLYLLSLLQVSRVKEVVMEILQQVMKLP